MGVSVRGVDEGHCLNQVLEDQREVREFFFVEREDFYNGNKWYSL